MTDPQDRLRRGENPFVAPRVRVPGGRTERLYEFKFGLVVYTNDPPGPRRAGAVFDLYEALYPNRIRRFVPTVPGSIPDKWTPAAAREFRSRWLPDLRQRAVWGYGFDDGRNEDGSLFMFHGFRPVTEKGMASFYRFEFPWNVDQAEVRRLAVDVARLVPFENGFGGYFLKPDVTRGASYDAMYAICQRFWGVEAWNLEVAAAHVLDGFAGVNWLTLIGESLRSRDPEAVEEAKRVAVAFDESPHGVVLQAAERAQLGDRNRREAMPGYVAVARALLPLQVKAFGSFGGEKWDEANSLAWLRRFTHPDEV
jgi:hypothetical protein